ncbi:MAG: hypothetical protein KDA96_26710, partial [Planctomycetaceae bacterium]|nr:hypothetical protein [Planctomycetaceae bacterium]
ALSPKAAEWMRIHSQYSQNAVRLQELEDEVDYLERVTAALKDDPQFARHLAAASLPTASSSDAQSSQQILPVKGNLLFGGSLPVEKTTSAPTPARLLPGASLILHFATHQQHRHWLLITAAGLTILSFTFLNESENGYLRWMRRTAGFVVTAPLRRYRVATTHTGTDPASEQSADEAE